MPIKDKERAREYKKLWMAKYRQQQKGNVEPVEPNNFVEPLASVEPSFVEPNPKVEPENVEPLKSVEPKLVEPVEPKKENVEPDVEPQENILQPLKCSRCPELENSISNFANLVLQEQEKSKSLTHSIRELNKEIINKNQQEEKLLKEKEKESENEDEKEDEEEQEI